MESPSKEPSREEWRAEAQAVINDIREHVTEAFISEKLISSQKIIFINVKTIEGDRYCVQLTCKGFEIVGNDFDQNVLLEQQQFETPYSLLQSISPRFVTSFGESLNEKLKSLESIQRSNE